MEGDALKVLVEHLDSEYPNWRGRIGRLAVDGLFAFVQDTVSEPDRAHFPAMHTTDLIEEFDGVNPLLLGEISEGWRWSILEALLNAWMSASDVHRIAHMLNVLPSFPIEYIAEFVGVRVLCGYLPPRCPTLPEACMFCQSGRDTDEGEV